MRNVNLERWRGRRDAEVLEPETVEFEAKARRGDSCRGCLFEAQWAKVCDRVQVEATRRGLPACSDGYVFVLRERDSRQLSIENVLNIPPSGSI